MFPYCLYSHFIFTPSSFLFFSFFPFPFLFLFLVFFFFSPFLPRYFLYVLFEAFLFGQYVKSTISTLEGPELAT